MPFGGALALLQLTVLAWGPAGPTEPIAVRVEFEGPATCSDSARFYARVRARTERVRKAGPGEPGLDLRVRLRPPVGGKVHGELSIRDERGAASTRTVDGASCEEVVEALSLTAALALDPSATLAPLAADDAPADDDGASTAGSAGAAQDGPARDGAAPTTSKAARAAVKPPASGSSAASADDGLRDETPAGDSSTALGFGFELGAALGLANVVSSQLSAGASLFGRVRLRGGGRGSLGLALAYSGSELLSSDDALAVRLTSLALDVCPVRWGSSISLEPCALLSGGLLAASSSGISDPDSSLRSHFALGGLGRLALRVASRAQLELEFGALFPLVHREYVLSAPERFLGETPRVSWLGTLGLSYQF